MKNHPLTTATETDLPRRGRPPVPEATLINKIQQSTFHLLQTKGVEGVSVDEICRNARVAKKTFYRFYADKESLIERIIVDWSSTRVIPDLAIPQSREQTVHILTLFFTELAQRALSAESVALFRLLQNERGKQQQFLRMYQEMGIENASLLLNRWFEHIQHLPFINPDWPQNTAKQLQALIISPVLREILLGLTPPVPAYDIRPRINDALTFISPLLFHRT